MKKLYLLILLLFFAAVLFFIFNRSFDIKITVKSYGVAAQKIDLTIAENLKDLLAQIEELSDFYIFSHDEYCSIYCKIKPFVLNKNSVISRIKSAIISKKEILPYDLEFEIDEEYKKTYPFALVIYSDIADYDLLKDYSDKTIDKILDEKISSKVFEASMPEKCVYVYFLNSDLLKYSLSLTDIKNILNKNNIFQNASFDYGKQAYLQMLLNTSFESERNIKSIRIPYINSDFSYYLNNVFKVNYTARVPQKNYIAYNLSKAQALFVSPRKFLPDFLLYFKLKVLCAKLNSTFPDFVRVDIIYTKNYSPVEVYFDGTSSIISTFFEYSKIAKILRQNKIKNPLFFIGSDLPNISFKDEFFECQKNKLTIFSPRSSKRKVIKILNDNNFFVSSDIKKITFEDIDIDNLYDKVSKFKSQNPENIFFTQYLGKTNAISYTIDENSLIDYNLEKEDVLNALRAQNDGILCGYFFDNSSKIPVILKNLNPSENAFVYSKTIKNLVSLSSLVSKKTSDVYDLITRKGTKYYAVLYYK